MYLRAIGSLLTRRFSPRALQAVQGSATRCSFHSLRDLSTGDVLNGAAVFTAAALAGAGGTLAVHYFKKGTDVDESAAAKMIRARKEVTEDKVITRDVRKLDMKERFEQWIMKNEKKYRDEEEKAMRFQLFKATIEWIESQPPSVQKRMFPEISYFADFTEQEQQLLLAFPDEATRTMNNEMQRFLQAKYEKGESLVWKPTVKQGDKQATQVSA